MYCLYCRVSTKRQGDSGLGLQAQRDIVKHFYPDIHKEFIEVRSGKNIQDRPILMEAIDYCISNDMVLVVAKVDRLTRSTKDGLHILEKLKGRIRFCDLPGEPDKFMLTLFFAFAERERELISIRTKGALKSAKERGRKLGVADPKGGRVPWLEEFRKVANGIRSDDSRKNPDNIRAKNYARELHQNGAKIRVIVQRLNEGGFDTPSGKGSWSNGSVHRLLRSE